MSTRVLTAAGPLAHELTADHGSAALLKELWASATTFALVRFGKAPVDAADLLVPTPALKRVEAAVGPVRDRLVGAKWVSEWPGTNGAGTTTLWLECRAGGTPPFALDDALLWEGVGHLQDFQLYDARGLRLFACSHEGFGRLYGSAAEFARWGLTASKRAFWPVQLVGKNIDAALLAHLRAG